MESDSMEFFKEAEAADSGLYSKVSEDDIFCESFNGTTYLVKNTDTDEMYTAKVYRPEVEDSEKNKFSGNISKIIHLNHPSILPIYAYMFDFEDCDDQLTVLTKYLPNAYSLRKIFSNQEEIEQWTPAKRYANLITIAYAMQYIHAQGIKHGNLKPGNILHDDNFYPILYDFCLSWLFRSKYRYNVGNDISNKFNNDDSILYLAPEILDNLKNQSITFSSDTYSFSLIAYELITGQKPFDLSKSGFDTYYEYAQHIRKNKIRPDLSIIKDEKIKSFLNSCWKENPEERDSFNAIVDELNNDVFLAYFGLSPFMTKVKNLKNYLIDNQYHKITNQESNLPLLPQTSKELFEYLHFEKEFEFVKSLGQGSFGEVSQIENKENKQMYAAKQSIRSRESDQKDFFKEIEFMFYIRHPTVLEIYGYFFHKEGNKDVPFIVTTYMENQSLEQIFSHETIHSDAWTPTKRFINFIGIAYGIKHIHSLKIIHLDLKPGNILLDNNFYPKIADFGNSILCNKINDKMYEELKNYKGTPIYAAPELSKDYEIRFDPFKTDVFSFAMIAYQLITNEPPFALPSKIPQRELYELMNEIADDETKRPDLSIITEDEVKSFLEHCWKSDPDKRYSSTEVVEEIEFQFDVFMRAFGNDLDKDEINAYLQLVKEKQTPDEIYAESCKKAADDSDDVFAMIHYADMLYKGERVKVSKKEASLYYKKAADEGNLEAMKKYIEMVKNGDGIEVNEEEASYYSNLLAEKNKINQQIEKGKGQIIDYFKEEADNGNIFAMNYFAEMMYDGDGIHSHKKEAAKYFKKIADSFIKESQNNEKAQEQENPNQNQNQNVQEDPNQNVQVEEMIEVFEEQNKNMSTLNQLSMNSVVNYANMLLNGDGIQMDKREAANYFRFAADKKNVDACCTLGKMLFKGDGIKVNMEDAFKYFSTAIDSDSNVGFKGNSDAVNFYGYMASKGLGMNVDKSLAARLYKMASDQGNVAAMNNYGYMLSHGIELHVDKASAAKYYKLAADQGNKDAMINYANMLYKGDGVPFDIEKSAYYYHMALNK